MQTVFAQKFLIGTGVEFKFLNINSETLSGPSTIIDKSTYLSAFGYLKYDSFDNKHFPKKGWFFSGNIQSYLLSSDYTKTFNPFSIAKADFAIAKTVLNKITTTFQSEAGFSFGNESLPFFNFALGGFGYATLNNFRPFYGYNFLGIAANSYLKAATTVDYEIFKKNHINLSANFANLQDNLFQSFDWLSIPKYSGYALGYGLETIIGPIEIKHSWSPETRQGYTWFSVGFWF
jgi:NTE family protein